MPITPIASTGLPGTYILEATYGNIPKGLESHNDVYMLGYSTKSGAPVEVPTFIQDYENFANVFGSTASASSVQMYFAQRPGNGLYFVNVAPKATRSLTIPTVTVGATYSLTIDGFTVSRVAVTADTQASILADLKQKLGTEAPYLGNIVGASLRTPSTAVVSSTANITLGTVTVAPAYPVAQDVIDSAIVAFDDDELNQGFLIAPEFFYTFTSQSELSTLGNGLEAIASDPKRYWIAFADCSLNAATQKAGGGAVAVAKAEREALSTAKGHLYFYFPYVINGTGVKVPASAMVAGLAVRTFREQGYRTPAGKELEVYGVSGLSYPVNDRIQTQLNPMGVNCIRNFRRDGITVYGARSLSTNPFYTFFLTRLTLNILARTVAEALEFFVFRTIDGEGATYGEIKATATEICEQLRTAGLLFGATGTEAYRIVCDGTNNTGLDLDNGIVRIKIFVKPSPTAEVILIELYRTSLSTSLTVQTAIDTAVTDPTGNASNEGKVN